MGFWTQLLKELREKKNLTLFKQLIPKMINKHSYTTRHTAFDKNKN